MTTSFSKYTPIKVKKIQALISGKVKKNEAQTKKWLSYKKDVYYTSTPLTSTRPRPLGEILSRIISIYHILSAPSITVTLYVIHTFNAFVLRCTLSSSIDTLIPVDTPPLKILIGRIANLGAFH